MLVKQNYPLIILILFHSGYIPMDICDIVEICRELAKPMGHVQTFAFNQDIINNIIPINNSYPLSKIEFTRTDDYLAWLPNMNVDESHGMLKFYMDRNDHEILEALLKDRNIEAFVDIKLSGLNNLNMCFTQTKEVEQHLFPPKITSNGTIHNKSQHICYEYNITIAEINSMLRLSYSISGRPDFSQNVNFRTFEIYKNGKWIEKPFFPFGFWINNSYLTHIVLNKAQFVSDDKTFKLHIVLDDCLARHKKYGNSQRRKTTFLYHDNAIPYSSTGLCHIENDKLYNVIHKLPETVNNSQFLDLGLGKYTEQSNGALIVEIPSRYTVTLFQREENYTIFEPDLNNYQKAFGVKRWMPGIRNGSIDNNYGNQRSFTLQMSQALNEGTYCTLDIRALNTSDIPEFSLRAGQRVNITQTYDSLELAGLGHNNSFINLKWAYCFIKAIHCIKGKRELKRIFRINYQVWGSNVIYVDFVLRAQIMSCNN